MCEGPVDIHRSVLLTRVGVLCPEDRHFGFAKAGSVRGTTRGPTRVALLFWSVNFRFAGRLNRGIAQF